MGLALVRSLVELHGGKVFAYSAGPGTESIFTVRLPRHQSAAALGSHADPAIVDVPATSRKIMIVDDNLDAATAIAMLLDDLGHDVHFENDPLVALDKASEIRPEIFLLDIGMPQMNGNELAVRLRQRPELRNAVLVAVSGYAQEKDRAATLASGFDYHFAKPLEIDRIARIANHIRHEG